MLSEPVNILAVEGGMVHVQTSRKAACGKCSLKGGCGQYLLSPDKESLWLNLSAIGLVPEKKGQDKKEQDKTGLGKSAHDNYAEQGAAQQKAGQHEQPLVPGSRALLRLEGDAVARLALLFYLLPLGLLLLFTLLANAMSSSEAWLMVSALAGLLLGFALLPAALRVLSDSCRPVLLSMDAAESLPEFHDES